MNTTPSIHRSPIIGIALEPAGWHPAAWRLQGIAPAELFSARYWSELLRDIDSSVVDFVTFEESIGLQSSDFRRIDDKEDQVRGRLSPVALTALAVFETQRLGVIATRNLTHSEPYSIATEIASLNLLSGGRVGLRAQVTSRSIDRRHFVRPQPVPELRESDIYFPERIEPDSNRSSRAQPSRSKYSEDCGRPGRKAHSKKAPMADLSISTRSLTS